MLYSAGLSLHLLCWLTWSMQLGKIYCIEYAALASSESFKSDHRESRMTYLDRNVETYFWLTVVSPVLLLFPLTSNPITHLEEE